MSTAKSIVYKIPQLLMLVALVTFIVVRAQTPSLESQETESTASSIVTLLQVQKLYPDAASFEYSAKPDAMSEVFDESGNTIGYFIVTTPHADDIKGYGGPVPLLIGIDDDGKIKGVSFLPNAESGGFIKIVTAEGVLDAWNGLTVDEALDQQVDTVSGATMTSSAVIESFKKRLFFFLSKK